MLAAIHIQLIVGTIFIILYSVTILGLVLVIITENRNPLKTIPWVIVLLLAPGIGLLFYSSLDKITGNNGSYRGVPINAS